jgi:hypothetical protein
VNQFCEFGRAFVNVVVPFCEIDLPFAEIYINTPFHGTICLKAREPAPGD